MLTRSLFATVLGITLSGAPAQAVEKSASLTLSLKVQKIVMLVFPDDPENAERELNMTVDQEGCTGADDVCFDGVSNLDFYLVGNSRVRVRARPTRSRKINNRRLGRWTYVAGGAAEVPNFYYDVNLEVVDLNAPFTLPAPVSPLDIDLAALTAVKHDWKELVDLRNGTMQGRVTIQPVFDEYQSLPGDAPITQEFAAVGDYEATVSLIVNTR